MRDLHSPDQAHGRRDRHRRVDHDRHVRRRRMQKDDPITVALLIVRGSYEQPGIQPVRDQQARRPCEPRGQATRQPIDIWGRAEAMKPGPGHLFDLYSRLMRTATAEASGASVTPRTANAPSRYSG